jgi:hypothetical protein
LCPTPPLRTPSQTCIDVLGPSRLLKSHNLEKENEKETETEAEREKETETESHAGRTNDPARENRKEVRI